MSFIQNVKITLSFRVHSGSYNTIIKRYFTSFFLPYFELFWLSQTYLNTSNSFSLTLTSCNTFTTTKYFLIYYEHLVHINSTFSYSLNKLLRKFSINPLGVVSQILIPRVRIVSIIVRPIYYTQRLIRSDT